MSWKEPSRACLLKTLPNCVGAGPTLRQSANWRALFVGFSPIGASSTLGNRANGKRELFKGILQEMSSGHMKSILRGI